MKCFVLIISVFLFTFFGGCIKEKTATKPSLTPKKKAEFKREVFDAKKDSGLAAVGKIKFFETKWCTVTLVAEDIGITAGHCFLKSGKKIELTAFTDVSFITKEGKKVKNVKVKSVLKRKINPDYAIVKFNKKISSNIIKPLKLSNLKYAEMLQDTDKLGCAGFNGDRELGGSGKNLTISRNIKIYYQTSNSSRLDTNCVSTHGGSGGLFFEEKVNTETSEKEFYFSGVIWGVTGDNYDKKGNLIGERDAITSITPVKVFKKELMKIIDEDRQFKR